nr:hypothetical protein [Tanacetum cinerariifolium]
GKRKKRVAFVSESPPVKKARAQAALATEDVTSSSVTPTPGRVLEDVSHDNVKTRPPFGRFVVLSSSSADTDIPASPQVALLVTSAPTVVNAPVVEPVGNDCRSSGSGPKDEALSTTPSQGSSADDFYESQTIDFASALNVYVPNWNVTNNAWIDNPAICRNLFDHITPPGYWAALRNQHDVAFLDAKLIDSAAIVQQRDAKIADLKARLEKSEADAAKVIELRKRVFDLEATVAIKVGELTNFRTENFGLVERVFALESKCDSLKNQVVGEGKMREEFVSQRAATKRCFAKRVAELDTRIFYVRRDMDNDLYPYMLTDIAGRRWVVGHSFRLAVYKHSTEAYDPEVEGKYVVAVSKFEGVSFPLLDELKSLKDSPIALIMFALILKDDHGNRVVAPEFTRFQPSIDHVVMPVYSEFGSVDREMILSDAIFAIRQFVERRGMCPPLSSTMGEASSSTPPPDSSFGVADYHVSTLVPVNDEGSADQASTAPPHDDLFDTFILDRPSDA